MSTSRLHRALTLLAVLLGTSALAEAQGVGFRELTMKDPVGGGTMSGLVFYPAAQPSLPLPVGLWRVDAGRELEPVPGRYPLVLISHGHGGTPGGTTTSPRRSPARASSSRRSTTLAPTSRTPMVRRPPRTRCGSAARGT